VRIAEVGTGHVSMISGSAARSTVWPTIADWIKTAGDETRS
jgi:hypothetical protein